MKLEVIWLDARDCRSLWIDNREWMTNVGIELLGQLVTKVQKCKKSKIQKKCEFCSSPGVGRVYANCCRRERLNSELWIPPVRNLISPNALNANSFSTSRQRILIAGDPKHYIALQNLKLRRHDVFLGVSWWGFWIAHIYKQRNQHVLPSKKIMQLRMFLGEMKKKQV